MRPHDEDRLLAWLRRRAGPGRPLIGDDAALIELHGGVALTVDTQIEGVHYLPGLDPALIAARLLAVNLSDLAACGAEPAYALLALAAPPGFDHQRFFRSLLAACRHHGVRLAGGDLARSAPTTAALTLVGRRRRGGRFLRRNAARPGDLLWLGGTVGESAAGRFVLALGGAPGVHAPVPGSIRAAAARAAARRAIRRHLAPQPQLELGAWLAHRRRASAIDLSDGLARDLHRLCRESGVGAEIDAERLPLAPGFTEICAALGREPLALALGGGEDYVLLFALPAGVRPPRRLGCTPIGRITARRAVVLIEGSTRRALPPMGWDHLAGQG